MEEAKRKKARQLVQRKINTFIRFLLRAHGWAKKMYNGKGDRSGAAIVG